MAGTILENLSGRKLTVLVIVLVIGQFICFLIGGLIAPVPASVQTILGTVCADIPGSYNDTSIWLYSRGNGRCKQIDNEIVENGRENVDNNGENSNIIENTDINMANKIVYVFQMPLPREGRILDYSRWQQNLIGILQIGIGHHQHNYHHFNQQQLQQQKQHQQQQQQQQSQLTNFLIEPKMDITLDARLAYRNKWSADNEWTYLSSSLEQRELTCSPNPDSLNDEYGCSTIPLFELGSLHHDYYLLNIRLPIDTERKMNLNIGHIRELQLTVIYQNGGFTKVWVSLKTIFCPLIIAIMLYFWRRVHLLDRSPVLLEYMLIYLGGALTILNFPLEYFTLIIDMPFMLLLGDIRQGIFYAMLLSFWLVFAGEHMLIQDNPVIERNSLKIYWRHLSAVAVGCVSLFIFDMCERGIQLRNPFYTISMSQFGSRIALSFIILAGISACIYFIFLCYMIWKVFCNIRIKRTSFPMMTTARRLNYEGIIYRFQFLMLATLLCAALTVIGFIMGQVADGQLKWNETVELEMTSAFFTGVYGMWNIYICALMILYAPSHKQWTVNCSGNEQIVSEEIEFNNLPSDSNPSEISSLTSFTRKAAFD